MKKYVSVIFALHLVSMNLFAWTNGELLVWMDSDRGYALAPAAKKFETEFGIKVTIESPEKITDSFSIAAQAGKGPDIVIWAHDKLGEWADGRIDRPARAFKGICEQILPKGLAGCASR
jgi:maltose/maltodextrin transport system substrate-binding protein